MLRAMRWICGSESLDLMSISALPWIADKGLRRSWTMEVISALESAGSLTVVITALRSSLWWVAWACRGDAIPQESDQFVFGKEFGLLPGIYFLHQAFQLAAGRGLPKLDYKCSSHDEFRIGASGSSACGYFVELL